MAEFAVLRAFLPARINACADLPTQTVLHSKLKSIMSSAYHAPSLHWCASKLARFYDSAGILTCCPSVTPFGLTLGSTNPPMTDIAEETLDFRRGGFSPPSRYSCQHSHLMPLQHTSQYTFTADINAPLPYVLQNAGQATASVLCLSPVKLSARNR